jgi:hypothetical protein
MQVFTEENYNGNTWPLFYLKNFIYSLFRIFWVTTDSAAISNITLRPESGLVPFASTYCSSDYFFSQYAYEGR